MKLIPLTQGKFALVDDEDYQYLKQWKWHWSAGYAERKEYPGGKQTHVHMHRVILNAPKGVLVDHKDGDTLNNQRANLRPSTHSTNAMNMRKHRGSSRYKGVCKEGNSFRVQIWKDNKKVFSTMTKNERHAAMIYDLNATAVFGEYARLNFNPDSLVIHE
jgi:HNH endonuclease